MNEPEDHYSDKDTERRREAALKKMLATPPKPHAKQKPSLKKRKAKKR
jgi:hypothetical protein